MSSLIQYYSACTNAIEPSENCEVPFSVNMVFNLDELLDIIVNQVITHKHFRMGNRKKDIRSLRLVSKNWLSSVSRVLYKNSLPLIKFEFGQSSTSAENVEQYAQTLRKFVKEFASAFSSNNKNAPTFSLDIGFLFFQNGNFPILQSCLAQCGQGLVKLKIKLSKPTDLPCTLPKFTLPVLRKLITNDGSSILDTFSEEESETEEDHQEMTCISNTGNLLKHLLEGSSSLQELTFQNTVGLDILGFDNILLPSTLWKLGVNAIGKKDIPILSKNVLPKLSNLSMRIDEITVLDDSFFNMLKNWKKSLKELQILFTRQDDMMSLNNIRFPVMEKLDSLNLTQPKFDPNRNDRSLEMCFPCLTHLNASFFEFEFEMWCVNSVFQLVKELRIYLYDNEGLSHVPINLRNIQLTHMAFPNVTSLEVNVSGSDPSVLQYIFKEMVQLKILHVAAYETESASSNLWDALLIGTSVETLEIVKDDLDNPSNATALESADIPSIRCLKNLSNLDLSSYKKNGKVQHGTQLISEVSFIYGFFKMPELHSLYLEGRFKISDAMQKFLKPKKGPFLTIL